MASAQDYRFIERCFVVAPMRRPPGRTIRNYLGGRHIGAPTEDVRFNYPCIGFADAMNGVPTMV